MSLGAQERAIQQGLRLDEQVPGQLDKGGAASGRSVLTDDQVEAVIANGAATPGNASLTTTQAATVAADLAGRGTVSLFGDSRQANCFTAQSTIVSGVVVDTGQTQQQGIAINLIALLNGGLLIDGMFAVGGKSLAEVVTEQLPLEQAKTTHSEWAWLDAAYNLKGAVLADLQASHQAFVSGCYAMGMKVCSFTCMGSTALSAGDSAILEQYNAYLKNFHSPNGVHVVLDAAAVCMDPATGGILTAYGLASEAPNPVHLNYVGGMAGAVALYPVASKIWPPRNRMLGGVGQTNQYAANPAAYGVDGTLNTGATGTVAHNWESGSSVGSSTAVASKQTISGKPTPAQRLVTTCVGNASADCFTGPATGTDSGWTVGQRIRGVASLPANTFSAGGHVLLEMRFLNAGFGTISTVYGHYADATYTNAQPPDQAQFLQTGQVVVPALTAHINLRVRQGGEVASVITSDVERLENQPA